MHKIRVKIKRSSHPNKRGAPIHLAYSPNYRLMQLLWRFHKADVDDQISIPHGDSIDGNKKYQLNPYTGKVYSNKTVVGNLQKKEFKRLWGDIFFTAFVDGARKTYSEKYPDRPLPPLPTLRFKRSRRTIVNRYRPKVFFSYKSASRMVTVSNQEYEVSLGTEILK